MVRRIVWDEEALAEKKAILLYWKERNKSNEYSKKLNALFKREVKLISKYPYLGKPTNVYGVRALVVADYLILYKVFLTEIWVVCVWDTRQDPEKLDLK